MTLIEILVAVAIVAILAAGLYSVSNYVETQAKIKLTESTIEILTGALEQYYDFYGSFPDPNATYPAGCDLPVEKLYYKLTLAPEAKKILNQIKPSLIVNVNTNESPAKIFPEVVDAWGTAMKYDYIKNTVQQDNFPVITSAGPDKDFNKTDDNLTSR